MSENSWRPQTNKKNFVQRLWTFTNIYFLTKIHEVWKMFFMAHHCHHHLSPTCLLTLGGPPGDSGHSERASKGPRSELSSFRGPGFYTFRWDPRNLGPTSQQVKQEKDTSPLTCPKLWAEAGICQLFTCNGGVSIWMQYFWLTKQTRWSLALASP